MGLPIHHPGGGKLGSQKRVILAAQNEPKSGVPSIVYLHAGLEIRSAIQYAINQESNRDTHALGPWKIFMPLCVVTIQFGSTIAKMANLSTLTLG